jgi:hypothetical protein
VCLLFFSSNHSLTAELLSDLVSATFVLLFSLSSHTHVSLLYFYLGEYNIKIVLSKWDIVVWVIWSDSGEGLNNGVSR